MHVVPKEKNFFEKTPNFAQNCVKRKSKISKQ